jgi:hypothetical protein
MRVSRSVAGAVLAALGMAILASRTGVRAQAPAPREMIAWVPMPIEPSKWVAPNRPHRKLSEAAREAQGRAELDRDGGQRRHAARRVHLDGAG